MEAIELPLVDGKEPGLVFLLLPGYDPDRFQGLQFELFRERGLLNVYCYESGYEEHDDCEGIVVPVALTDRNIPAVEDLQTLRVVDPNGLEEEDVGEENYRRILEAHETFGDLSGN